MKKSNYDKTPFTRVEGYDSQVWRGYEKIGTQLAALAGNKKKFIITLDCYPGVRDEEIVKGLTKTFKPDKILFSRDAAKSTAELNALFSRNITEDRVFGILSHHTITDFFDAGKLENLKKEAATLPSGAILVYGIGASLISRGDVLVYADLARWEIQQRYRSKETGNWWADNRDEELLRKYKRGYFIDWRIADRHKKDLFREADYFLDTNARDDPKMAAGEAVRTGMAKTVSGPFRVVPYFDAGVWGGQWMKRTFALGENNSNYAWAFDCVPEENSLLLKFGETLMEFPSIDLVFFWPDELLGPRVRSRFGTEFPIRFDMLDTMGGQNLSLQVHPQTEYIQEQFGMHYTQDESYYILDCEKNTHVYLGLREKVSVSSLLDDLRRAQKGNSFEAEKYVNLVPVKTHDHFLIPAGTIHCSGAGTMVLEISATPYIFTFKLWDWGRLGLDGLPRPVHIDHGARNIRERRTSWIMENCVNRIQPIASGDGWREEKTGLHENEFIETRRHWFTGPVLHAAQGGVQVLNLVQGSEAVVESPAGAFEPFTVHYAETFIVPARIGEYRIRPAGKPGEEMGTIKAYVRF